MHIRALLHATHLTALASLGGLLVAIAPAAAQPRVDTGNVSQVIAASNTWRFDKISREKKKEKARWVETRDNGQRFDWVESGHDATTVTLMYASPDRSLRRTAHLNLKTMQVDIGTTVVDQRGGVGTGSQELAFITALYGVSADSATDTCRPQATKVGVKCNCALSSLRPLQGAVGLTEVMDKKAQILAKEDKERLDLAYDPIKVVRGPGGDLYVTDHHHGARAWLEAGHPVGTCEIESDTLPTAPPEFWEALKAKNWVRLADEKGTPISPDALPKTLQLLPDDPYRTLAWMVRKQDGFCRAYMKGATEFAEFRWADWMRDKPELPFATVKSSPATVLPAALTLAKSPAAKDLPGYRGDRPNGPCPPDES
jgi:hypothetical protein